MDYILENVTIDPLEDFTSLISESVWDDEYFREMADGATKKNIFQKLWSMIKRLWSIIKTKANQIKAWFVGLFKHKKVNDRTIDQIAEYVLGEVDEAPTSKHLNFRYEDDSRITIKYVKNTIKKNLPGYKEEVPGHDKDDRPHLQGTVLIFHLIKKPYLLDPVMDMMQSIIDNEGEITFSYERAKNAVNNIWAGTAFGLRCTITLEEWTVLNDKLTKFHKIMEVVDDDTMGMIQLHDSSGNKLDSKFLKIINEICQIAKFLQYGINTIGDGMRQVYTLDDKYHNKINSENFRELLPKFVKMCVEYNVPSKFIHYAVRQICDVSINAKVNDPSTKADEKKTLTGNGRFVIFPGAQNLQDKVIKVGYNGLGVRGNRNEFMVWNKVKDIPEIADELYHIEDINDPDNYVILCDRAEPINHYEGTEEWNTKMKNLCIKYKVGFIIRCNDGGFAKTKDGKVICVDYGTVHRWDQYVKN